ncbi:hypothetical protein V8E52_007540 [Russula decolorans]
MATTAASTLDLPRRGYSLDLSSPSTNINGSGTNISEFRHFSPVRGFAVRAIFTVQVTWWGNKFRDLYATELREESRGEGGKIYELLMVWYSPPLGIDTLLPTMSPKSLSRILVAHTYGTVTDNHIPSQGEVIVARGAASPFLTPAQFGDPIEVGGWKDCRPSWIIAVPMLTDLTFMILSRDEFRRLEAYSRLSVLPNSGTVPLFPPGGGSVVPEIPDASSLGKDNASGPRPPRPPPTMPVPFSPNIAASVPHHYGSSPPNMVYPPPQSVRLEEPPIHKTGAIVGALP